MNNQTEQNQPFNQILLQAIDDALTAIGGSTKNWIYHLLSKQKGITRDQIPDKMEELHLTLESIFGAGTSHIEVYLIALLESRVNVKCPTTLKGKTMGDWVVFLRQEYEKQ
ncbi:MAG TPA: hypothetical protein VLH35_01520 [Candidatus Acidoferrales bacterium]|nr:hypothetical protein [Candidatus Acidoferrales bacterium]